MTRRFASVRALRVFVFTAMAIAAGAPAFAQMRADLIVSGLTQPVAFVQDPSDATVQAIVQQNGRIRILKGGVLQATDYLNLSSVVMNSGEQGLLGMAFAPDYATSGRVYVNFVNLSGNTVIARFVRSAADPLRADPATRFDLLWPGGQRFIFQDFSNHNGGNLAFGPDGYLYIGMGDGGSGDDPFHNAQNPMSLLGKMLRVDVSVPNSDPEGYNVPATNPFVGQSGILAEIWSLGLRNPWRWSFDNVKRGGTGALVMGDVGQNAWEEVDYEPAGRGGRNYGWRNREGAHNNVTTLPAFSTPLIEPAFEYSHGDGHSITGGYVYRGTALGAAFRGRYLFADFVDSRVWSIKLTTNAATGAVTGSDRIEYTSVLGSAAANPASFGEDAAGELYLVSYVGRVYRLVGTEPVTSSGRRLPAGVEPIGFATPRAPSTSALMVTALQLIVGGDPGAGIRLLTAAAEIIADELVDANHVCEGELDLLGRDLPGADDFAFGHFTLGGRDGLVRLRDTGNTPAHQLRCAQSRHDGKLELIHFDGTINH